MEDFYQVFLDDGQLLFVRVIVGLFARRRDTSNQWTSIHISAIHFPPIKSITQLWVVPITTDSQPVVGVQFVINTGIKLILVCCLHCVTRFTHLLVYNNTKKYCTMSSN